MDDELLLNALVESDETEEEEVPGQINIQLRPGETHKQAWARFIMQPTFLAYNSIDMLTVDPNRPVDPNELIQELQNQTDLLKEGNSDRAESILSAQSHTLDAMFHHLTRRAIRNMQEGYVDTGEKYLKLAMKAQSQCRTTLDSLTAMRRPIIKQTNIAHGHQQVNNFPEKEIPPNELLEETDGEQLEPGAAETPGRNDQTLEAVGKSHRAEDD